MCHEFSTFSKMDACAASLAIAAALSPAAFRRAKVGWLLPEE
jgi:hypothetical protein